MSITIDGERRGLADYARHNPEHIIIFFDNQERIGCGSNTCIRKLPNSYGFVVSRSPRMACSSFFSKEEFDPVYSSEISRLRTAIKLNPDNIFVIGEFVGEYANRSGICEEVFMPRIKQDLSEFGDQVLFGW